MTTIQHIEGSDWGDPPREGSHLVRRCTELRRQPLDQFTVEDLRIMLGQAIAVPILLPLAIEALVADPLAEGDFYAGDLLMSVLRLPASAWSGRPDELQSLQTTVAGIDLAETELPKDADATVASFLRITAPS